ncbi:unnamed protein product [Cylicocyclus nassatus]|uniref:AMP-dependent synthetase/ligase domain-containing protein n=1 Tax=Cylicocyclus nassatus TaxID=53992 RepID=A0AA36DV37_CYLNA|nr:unnamed protein product [Cylicocyclus nassatus]
MSAKSDVPLVKFPSEEKSFTRAFLGFVKNYEAKLAFIDPETNERLAFWDLENIVNQMKFHLDKLEVSSGKIVATLCGNSIDFILMCLAVVDLGAAILPINPASTVFEIEKYLLTCKVDHVIIETAYEEKMRKALARQEKFSKITVVNLKDLRGLREDEDIPKEKKEIELSGEETAFILFSSGTTGPPKAICHSHRSMLASLAQVIATTLTKSKFPFPSLLGDKMWHGVLPYFHAGGLVTVFVMLLEGVTLVINKKFTPATFLRILTEHKITFLSIVPTILDFLNNHPAVDAYDLSALKRVFFLINNLYIFVGAASSKESQLVALKKRLPNVEVLQMYGLTEAGLLIFMSPIGNTRLSSVGRPMPGVEAVVIGENKECLECNEVGELALRSPSMMVGYYDHSE